MGVDTDLAGILREVVQFLESLCDVDLPAKIENAKENLLQRSRSKLASLASIRDSTSPGPYLDMNVGKGLLLFPSKDDVDVEEYVGVEEQPAASRVSYQDYYESFQEFGGVAGDRKSAGKNRSSVSSRKFGCVEEAEEKLVEIYKTFTPATTMSKAHKYGSLDHRVERKSFGFVRGNIRSCWVGLVGSHLLIYSSEKDKQPPEVCSIRGYMGRPASNAIIKDQDHAKSAFEIFCPGNKTLQFIAKTPKEMDEWLAAIGKTRLIIQDRDSGMYERSMDEKMDQDSPEDTASTEERYQDVGGTISSPERKKSVVLTTTSPVLESVNGKKLTRTESGNKKDPPDVPSVAPPTLPLRLPRRLPSLPNEAALVPSYEPLDDGYEEDDIYHKIDDFRDDGRSYENVKTKKTSKRAKAKKESKKKDDKKEEKKEEKKKKRIEDIPELETYDDVEAKPEPKREETKKKRKSLFQDSPSSKEADVAETYDDVQAIVQDSSERPQKSPLVGILRSPRRDVEAQSDALIRSSLTYDDVLQPPSTVSIESPVKTESNESKESSEAAASSSPAKSPTKSPQRRWFLDRVRHKKESPKKEDKKSAKEAANAGKKLEKKEKRKLSLEPTPPIPPKTVEPELPTYDDISRYQGDVVSQNTSPGDEATVPSHVDALANYNSLPRPRPIYAKPPNPAIVVSPSGNREIVEDLYDDIANYRDSCAEADDLQEAKNTAMSLVADGRIAESEESRVEKPKVNGNCSCGAAVNGVNGPATRVSVIVPEDGKNVDNQLAVETEHYQIPRKDPPQVTVSGVTTAADEQQEELYDDVAILAEFRSRRRDSGSSSSRDVSTSSAISAVDKLAISMRKPWNRFGNCKKVNTRDSTAKNKSCGDLEELDDSNVEKTDSAKPNKLQKLINKMESTLGKQPTKAANSISNKTHNGE